MSDAIRCTYCGLDSGVTAAERLSRAEMPGWATGLSGGPDVSTARCEWAACPKCSEELEKDDGPSPS